MTPQEPPARLRFESFELDLRTRELLKDGRPVRLQDQPAKLLALLASRPGELVTRAEIEKALWGDDEFVEFEHGINTAMRKIREALGDDLGKPRFIETLPRKGYRFIAPVESSQPTGQPMGTKPPPSTETEAAVRSLRDKIPVRGQPAESIRAAPIEEFASDPPNLTAHPQALEGAEFTLPRRLARPLFLVVQLGYLAMYGAALYKAEALEEALERALMTPAESVAPLVVVSAMCGIAVRFYLLSSVGFNHPDAGAKFRRLFPLLFLLDALWAASPLLLVRKIGYGLALAGVAALAYLPFSQRTLIKGI